MYPFDILEIAETTDSKIIKMAYAKLIVKYSPEVDPDGFKKLREAYELALKLAKSKKESNKQSNKQSNAYKSTEDDQVSLHQNQIGEVSIEDLLDKEIQEDKIVNYDFASDDLFRELQYSSSGQISISIKALITDLWEHKTKQKKEISNQILMIEETIGQLEDKYNETMLKLKEYKAFYYKRITRTNVQSNIMKDIHKELDEIILALQEEKDHYQELLIYLKKELDQIRIDKGKLTKSVTRLEILFQEEVFSNRQNQYLNNNLSFSVINFLEDFKANYFNFSRRIEFDTWQALLNREVCLRLDTAEKISLEVLNFIKQHKFFPAQVWRLFDEYFAWSDNQDIIINTFEKEFFKELIKRINGVDVVDYNQLAFDFNNRQDIYIFVIEKTKECLIQDHLGEGKIYLEYAEEIIKLLEVSKPVELLLLEATFLQAEGKLVSAIEIYNRILMNDKYCYLAIIGKADACYEKNEIEEAYRLYKEAFLLGIYNQGVFYKVINCAKKLDKYQEMMFLMEKRTNFYCSNEEKLLVDEIYNVFIIPLEEQFQKYNLSVEKQYELALGYFEYGKYEEAECILKGLLNELETNFDIYLLYSKVLFSKKRFIELEEELNKNISFNRSIEINLLKGRLLALQGKSLEALEYYGQLTEEDSKNEEIICHKLKLLNNLSRHEQVIQLADKYIDCHVNRVILELEKAKALYGLMRYKEGLMLCRTLVVIAPEYVEIYILLFSILEKLKRYDEADDALIKCEEMKLVDDELFRKKGDLFSAKGEYEKALENYLKAIELNDKNYKAHLGRIELTFSYKEFDRCERFCNIAINSQYSSKDILMYQLKAIYNNKYAPTKRKLEDCYTISNILLSQNQEQLEVMNIKMDCLDSFIRFLFYEYSKRKINDFKLELIELCNKILVLDPYNTDASNFKDYYVGLQAKKSVNKIVDNPFSGIKLK